MTILSLLAPLPLLNETVLGVPEPFSYASRAFLAAMSPSSRQLFTIFRGQAIPTLFRPLPFLRCFCVRRIVSIACRVSHPHLSTPFSPTLYSYCFKRPFASLQDRFLLAPGCQRGCFMSLVFCAGVLLCLFLLALLVRVLCLSCCWREMFLSTTSNSIANICKSSFVLFAGRFPPLPPVPLPPPRSPL